MKAKIQLNYARSVSHVSQLQPQPQPAQSSRLGLSSPQPALLVQPGPQPVQLVEVKVEALK